MLSDAQLQPQLLPKTETALPNCAPWEQQPDEPAEWFDRFSRYACPLGYEFTPFRSFKLYTAAGHNGVHLSEWTQVAIDSEWAHRARQWADYDRATTARLWRERRLALREREFTAGEALLDAAMDALNELPKFVTTHTEIDPKKHTAVTYKKLQADTLLNVLQLATKLGWHAAELPEERPPRALLEVPVNATNPEKQKEFQAEQLTKLLLSVLDSTDVKAPDRAVAISKRIADLLGLDAPKQHVIEGSLDLNMKQYTVLASPDDWPTTPEPKELPAPDEAK